MLLFSSNHPPYRNLSSVLSLSIDRIEHAPHSHHDMVCQSWVPAQVLRAAAGIAPPAQLKAATTDAGYRACVTAESALDYCLVYDPVYDTRFDKCLCCSTTSFVQSFDTWAKSCASYIETSLTRSTTQLSVYSSFGSFCAAQSLCRSRTLPRVLFRRCFLG